MKYNNDSPNLKLLDTQMTTIESNGIINPSLEQNNKWSGAKPIHNCNKIQTTA
jgi:hypothetical protein